MKKSHFRLFALLVGLVACGGACFGLWKLWQQPVDAYWTATAFSPTLAASADRVEVYVDDEPLLKAVGEERLVLKQKGAEAPVVADKVVARVNNYERVRLARLPMMLGLAAGAGAGFVLFLIGLFTPLIASLHPDELVDLHLPT